MSAWLRARPRHLEQYKELLGILLEASTHVSETVLEVEDLTDYRLREVLAACDRYPKEAGKYAHLSRKVEARLAGIEGRTCLVIRSRTLTPDSLREAADRAGEDTELLTDLVRQMQEGVPPQQATPQRSPFDLITRQRREIDVQ